MNATSNNDEKIDDKSKPVEKEKSKSCSSRIIHQSKSMPLFGQVKYSSKEENISISHTDDKTPKIENEPNQKPAKRKGSIKELKIPSNAILLKIFINFIDFIDNYRCKKQHNNYSDTILFVYLQSH